MNRDFSRRDFNKLSVAALGGMVTGTAIGCGGGEKPAPADKDKAADKDKGGEKVSGADCWTDPDKNICRGLNMCAEHGQGEHECAGQGSCATNVTAHECGTHNSCACEGGCGETIGENACKGQGGCAVPIKDENMWKSAREKFEAALTKAGKKFGEAPPAKS